MERYRGHLLNWYDTASTAKLPPLYVSPLDSGNLVGHLVALAEGCKELLRAPVVGPGLIEALSDELELLREALGGDAAELRPFAERLAAARGTVPSVEGIGELLEAVPSAAAGEAAYW